MKIIGYLILLSAFLNCNSSKVNSSSKSESTETIESIEIHTYGGMLGVSEKIHLEPNFFQYEITNKVDSSQNKMTNLDNKQKEWNELVTSISLEDVRNFKEGESRLPIDGLDTRITVKTNVADYSAINDKTNSAWKTLSEEKEKIQIEISSY